MTGISTESRLRRVLHSEYQLRPMATIRDYYKLMFQACMGPSHIIADAHEFHFKLKRELHIVRPNPVLHLVEPISIISPIARLHLAPFLRTGISPETLIECCLQSNSGFTPVTPGVFKNLLSMLARILNERPFNVATKRSRAFLDNLPGPPFPPVHHSPRYRNLYQPHYRLVLVPIVDKLIGSR